MTPTEKIQNTIKTARTPPAPPKKRKLLSGIEGVGNNILLAGQTATGKSSFIADLAINGLKCFTMFTDLGNTGLNGMRSYAHSKGKLKEFDENHRYVLFNSNELEEVEAFIDNPEAVVEGYNDFSPNVSCWDGFGFHLKNSLTPDVEELVNKDKGYADLGFDNTAMMRGWGLVRNAIVRTLDKFLTSASGSTKIATCGVKFRSIVTSGDPNSPNAVREQIPLDEPDIDTGAKRVIQFAFDLALITKIATKDEPPVKKGDYCYKLGGEYCKKRYKLPELMPAGAYALLQEIEKQRK